MADVSDDRAVSPVFGYALTLSISTLLITGLLVAASGYVESQSRLTAENELNVVGQQVAADLAAADRLSRTDGANPDTLSITRAVPDRIVGSAYRIHLLNDTEGPTQPYLELRTVDPDVTVTVGVPLAPASSVEESSVDGGRFAVEIDADGDLVIRNV